MSDSIDPGSANIDNLVIEGCQEIHEHEIAGTEARGGFNGLIEDAPLGVSTSIVNGLSQQLIYQINLIVPNALVSFDDLNVDLGNAAFPFVPPAGKDALRKAIAKRGQTMKVNSAYRTLAQQLLLFNNRFNNDNPVAAPGTSNHQSGFSSRLVGSLWMEIRLMSIIAAQVRGICVRQLFSLSKYCGTKIIPMTSSMKMVSLETIPKRH
jgi:N-acetylmuramoyl-L-alanine amidase